MGNKPDKKQVKTLLNRTKVLDSWLKTAIDSEKEEIARLRRTADQFISEKRKAELAKEKEYQGFADEYDISGYAKENIEELFEAGVLNGKGGNMFDPFGNATRAEAAKIIYEAFKGGE